MLLHTHIPHFYVILKCLRTHKYTHTNQAGKNTFAQSQQRKLWLPHQMTLQPSNEHKNIYLCYVLRVCMSKCALGAFKKQNHHNIKCYHISAFVRIHPAEVAVSIGIYCGFSKDICKYVFSMYVCMQLSSSSCTRALLAELRRHAFVCTCNWIRGESLQSWLL